MDIRKNIKAIEALVVGASTPLVTYTKSCEAIGYANTGDTIALMVYNSAWDGRISPRNAEWAADRRERRGFTDKEVDEAYTSIHKAHLDQIADIARKLNY